MPAGVVILFLLIGYHWFCFNHRVRLSIGRGHFFVLREGVRGIREQWSGNWQNLKPDTVIVPDDFD